MQLVLYMKSHCVCETKIACCRRAIVVVVRRVRGDNGGSEIAIAAIVKLLVDGAEIRK